MVKIRLKRFGRKKRPFYRIVVTDIRTRRDGAPIAEAGFYDPIRKQLRVDTSLIESWLAKGAQPSATVTRLFDLAKASEPNTVIELPKKAKPEPKKPEPVKAEAAASEEETAAEASAASEEEQPEAEVAEASA